MNQSNKDLGIISAQELLDMELPPKAVEVRYEAEDNGFNLIHDHNKEYFIEASRINSRKKLIGWIVHLCSKGWVDNDAIRDLIKIVHAHFKWGSPYT